MRLRKKEGDFVHGEEVRERRMDKPERGEGKDRDEGVCVCVCVWG